MQFALQFISVRHRTDLEHLCPCTESENEETISLNRTSSVLFRLANVQVTGPLRPDFSLSVRYSDRFIVYRPSAILGRLR